MADRNRRLEEAMIALRARYGAALPRHVDQAGQLWRECAARRDDGSALAAFYAAVHRLAGTAGSFGFADVSAAAAEIEAVLGEALAAGRALSRAEREAVADTMARISALAATR